MTFPETISADYTLRPSELAEVLATLVKACQPCMVWGGPNSGKSQVSNQTADALGYECVHGRPRPAPRSRRPARHPVARRVRPHVARQSGGDPALPHLNYSFWANRCLIGNVPEAKAPGMLGMRMVSMATRDDLVEALSGRYGMRNRVEKTRILDEFVAVTSFHRKHV